MTNELANLFGIAARTAVVYVAIVLGLRIFGKRELGQMSLFDLVLILMISNAVQNAMTGPDTTLEGGLTAAVTLLALNWAFNRLGNRVPAVRLFLAGSPTLLVHDGKVIASHLKREGITEDELLMQVREHGIEDLRSVQEAVLETDGSISVIPAGQEKYHLRRKRQSQKLG